MWSDEITWELRTPSGEVWMQGGAPFDGDDCPNPECPSTGWTVVMTDSWGDGWHGNTLTVTDCLHNPLVGNITLSGSHATVDICLPPPEQYRVTVNGGPWQSEV